MANQHSLSLSPQGAAVPGNEGIQHEVDSWSPLPLGENGSPLSAAALVDSAPGSGAGSGSPVGMVQRGRFDYASSDIYTGQSDTGSVIFAESSASVAAPASVTDSVATSVRTGFAHHGYISEATVASNRTSRGEGAGPGAHSGGVGQGESVGYISRGNYAVPSDTASVIFASPPSSVAAPASVTASVATSVRTGFAHYGYVSEATVASNTTSAGSGSGSSPLSSSHGYGAAEARPLDPDSFSASDDMFSYSTSNYSEQNRQNTAFLSHLRNAPSLSDSASLPSINHMGPGDHQRRNTQSTLETQQAQNTSNNTSSQQRLQNPTRHTQNNGSVSSSLASSAAAGSSAWNTSTTTTTTTFSFPTVTASSMTSPPLRPPSSGGGSTMGGDSSVMPYASSVVSVPSQVVPPPTALENAVSGLTTAVAPIIVDPSNDFHHHIDNADNETTSSFHRVLPTTALVTRTTTSSSLTTLSTTFINHQANLQHSMLSMEAAPGGEDSRQYQSINNNRSGSSSSSSVTITTVQQNSTSNNGHAATSATDDEDAKLKAANEFIPPPPTIAAVGSSSTDGGGENTLQELEDMVMAKRGVAAASLPPERIKTDDATANDYGMHQRTLEEKLMRQQQQAPNQQQQQQQFDPHHLLQGGNLPVVQESSILHELEALNRSQSQEDPYNVARRRATFVRPGAYHQAPGQVAIRRARSRADSLQQGSTEASIIAATTTSTATNLQRYQSNASDVSSLGMRSVTHDMLANAIEMSTSQQQGQVIPEATQPPTRRHTYAGQAPAFPLRTASEGSRPLTTTSSSSSSSSPSEVASGSHSSMLSLEANRSDANMSQSITTASSLSFGGAVSIGGESAGDPNTQPQQQNNSTRGLVQAHPVQPTDIGTIVAADPVDSLAEQERNRYRDEEEEAHPKHPFQSRLVLWAIVGCTLVCTVAIVAVVVAVQVTGMDNDPPSYQNGGLASSPFSPRPFEPTTERGLNIQQRLDLEYGIREELTTSPTTSEEEEAATNATPLSLSITGSPPSSTTSSTPTGGRSVYSQAMSWLVNEDPLALDEDADNLLQRYLMAYFYFHTSQEGPWVSCNPADGDESKFCTYRYVSPFGDVFEEAPFNIRWLSDDHECEWAGVYCESLKVNQLSLNGYNLTGTFPTHIAKLSNLTILSLRDNHFHGSLPAELSDIPNLQNLRMNRNLFTGGIPHTWGGLTALTTLDVARNSLTGPLPELDIFPLTRLENLWINDNRFTGTISPHISTLTALKQLWLNNNAFSGALPNIGYLTNLEFVDVSSTMVTGSVPSEVGLLSNLIDIDLSSSYLGGTLPEELFDLTQLLELSLSGCNFTGTISTHVGKLTGLRNLLLNDNQFSGELPSELGRLELLIAVQVQHNEFVGVVPDSICLLKGPNTLNEFIADCTPTGELGEPRLECKADCCTSCCDADTGICDSN